MLFGTIKGTLIRPKIDKSRNDVSVREYGAEIEPNENMKLKLLFGTIKGT